jgi:hypothetical protein
LARCSISGSAGRIARDALGVIDLLNHELGPLARADARVVLLDTIPALVICSD